MPSRRAIPSIDRLLDRPVLVAAIDRYGRPTVTESTRRAAEAWRTQAETAESADPERIAAWIETTVATELASRLRPSLRPVINATGVVIHTNLGRAPLAASAIAHVAHVAAGYTNLEYDLAAGTRGRRHVHGERLLCALTGAEAAMVVNNNAAAALVTLAALAAGREVVVSRGELVEIGGGFRVPEILAESGAVLREVGTTNRTRVADYASAITDRTALLLRVHPSNFRVVGFTERPDAADLASLAHRFALPLVEDLGSGWLGLADPPVGLTDEPSVRDSLAAGADVVTFSGDKLLGGPQAGLIVGRHELVATISRHPLIRAVRADKLAYAALEATLALWAEAPNRAALPVFDMIAAPVAVVAERARRLVAALSADPTLACQTGPGSSTSGGGSAPDAAIPTVVVTVTTGHHSAAAFAARLRQTDPPVIARIEDDRVTLDLRTVRDAEIEALAGALRWAGSRGEAREG